MEVPCSSSVSNLSSHFHLHNLGNMSRPNMESNCEDFDTGSIQASGLADITKIFEQLSLQITSQNTQLREHFLSTTQKVSTDFQKLTQDHEDFKNTVKLELESLRKSFVDKTGTPSTVAGTVPPPPSTSSSSFIRSFATNLSQYSKPAHAVPTSTSLPSLGTDSQSQMMLFLADSFSKLSTALGEKGLESKSEWPQFSGDSKKFCAWYLSIIFIPGRNYMINILMMLLPVQQILLSMANCMLSCWFAWRVRLCRILSHDRIFVLMVFYFFKS